MQLVVPATRIKEVLLEMRNGGTGDHFGINKRDFTGSVAETRSRAGARNVGPARRSRDRELEREMQQYNGFRKNPKG